MHDHRQLFQEQSGSWPLAAENYRALSTVSSRELYIDGLRIRLQYNPARIKSSSANIDKVAIQGRPCFLCTKNRPVEQKYLPFHLNGKSDEISEVGLEKDSNAAFQILVNPFPVFPEHFTIAATEHRPQSILGQFETLLKLAQSMDDCVVFYNGPRCGASAPDHLHFQAGSKGVLPVESDFADWVGKHLTSLYKSGFFQIQKLEGFLRNGLLMMGKNRIEMSQYFEMIFGILESENKTRDEEPLLNLLCWYEKENWICLIFPRKAHRPDCYFRADDSKFLISPASVEMGGLFVAARLEDFERLNENIIREIYSDVSASKTDIDRLSGLITEKLAEKDYLK